jgi:hypothetical protein
MATLLGEVDKSYVTYVLGRGNGRKNPASADEVARYKKRLASPTFVAWRTEKEARMRASLAAGSAAGSEAAADATAA